MKRFFLFLISLVLFFNLWGQKGFYSTDSLISVGVTIIDGGDIRNSQICRVNYGDRIVDYTPDQISEYGFDDRLYFAKDILIDGSIKRVFLERVVDGGKSLYYYRSRGITLFFVDVGDGFLLRLPKVDEESRRKFTEVLTELTQDCIYTKDFIGLVSYSKRSMNEFFEKYNECRPSPFRRNKLGISMSYGFSRLSPKKDFAGIEVLDVFNYNYFGGITFGFFYEMPLFFKDFNIHLGVNFSQIGQSYREEILVDWTGFSHNPPGNVEDGDILTFFLTTNSWYLEFPVMVKYYQFTRNRFRPFLNVGGHLGYSFNNEAQIFQALKSDDFITIDLFNYSTPTSHLNAGYNLGVGLDIMLTPRSSFFLETRISKMSPIDTSNGDIHFSKTNFHLFTGIKF